MADSQSAASASSQSSLAICTSTVTVFPCSDTASPTASSPTGDPRGSIAGASPTDASTVNESSTVTASATSAAASSDSTLSLSQSPPTQPSDSSPPSPPSSTADDATAASSTSTAVLIAGPVPSTTSTSSPNHTPFVPGQSPTDSAADVQTEQSGPQSSETEGASGVVFQSSINDSSFTTATVTPTLLGTVGGTSTTRSIPSASSSPAGGNDSGSNSGTENSTGVHAQSAASKRAAVAGAAVGGTLGFLLLLVGFLFFLRRRNQAARARKARPVQKYRSMQGSVLGYGPDPFDRSTGIESVRTVADAFRGPGMIQYMSPAPSVHSARSLVQKMSRADDLDQFGAGVGDATPRSWATFQPQGSPLRESMSTADGDLGPARPGPVSPFIAVPLMTPTASEGAFSPPTAVPLSTSAPGFANFSSTRSSKASSSLYSAQTGSRLDPFRDSVVTGPSYDSVRRRSIGDSVDPFRDNAAAPGTHAGMYSPPGFAI